MDFRDIIIMRHAKSDWHSGAASDFDRPLNQRGLSDAPRMAQWMVTMKLKPEFLVSSPALRARQTTQAVVEQLALDESSVFFDKRMYLAGIESLLAIIKEVDDKFRSLMLVGHNPGLENLARYLSNDELPISPGGGLMTTANIFQLRVSKPWGQLKQRDAEFVQFMRPKQLP